VSLDRRHMRPSLAIGVPVTGCRLY
jgi:hypothetical protein